MPAAFLVAAVFTADQARTPCVIAAVHPSGSHVLVAIHALLRTAVAFAFALFTVGRAAPQRRSRDPIAFAVCALVMIAPTAFAPADSKTATGLLIAGDAFAVAGAAWLLVSVLALRRCFGVLPEARGLVVRGPYRLVRHPVYFGEIIAFAGFAIAAPVLRNVVTFAAVVGAQLVRTRLEERALTDAFPEYTSYARQTNRLLPLPRSWQQPLPASPAIVGASMSTSSDDEATPRLTEAAATAS